MIFGFIFDFLADLSAWLTGLLPTTGCGEIGAFPTLAVGWIGGYVNLPAMVALFSLVLAYEVAVFGFRLAVGIYKLLPLSGG